MPTYEITAPNGKTYHIDGPPGATDEQVRAQVLKQYPDAAGKPAYRKPYNYQDLITNKMTMGLSDKAVPAAEAGIQYLTGLVSGQKGNSFSARYQSEQKKRDQQREDYQKNNAAIDWATLPFNLMGLGEKAVLSVGNGVRSAVATGAGAGLISGAGQSRGNLHQQVNQTMASSGAGSVIAPAVNALAPSVVRAGGSIKNAIISKVSGKAAAQQPTAAGKILLKTLEDQGMTPNQAAKVMDEARANGVPLALMDTGDEVRGLASGLARKPGPNRTIMRDAVIARQEGQTERVQGAIARDLGPTANVRQQSEALIKKAQADAKPLYEQAYKNEGAGIFHGEASDLLKRPSMKKALANAVRIAAEEGRDPKSLGLVIGKDGLLTKVDKPTWQTWDYVKRGMDDVVESYRDPVTGRLNLDTEGRAVNNTLREFLGRVDKVNPDYAAARSAYGGPAKMASALNKGAKIASKDAETVQAEIRDMTAAEIDQYRLGVRSALSKMLEGRTDSADKVRALVGTPKKREVLVQLFGGKMEFDRFMKTLAQESMTNATYGRINAGSPTAANLADDSTVDGLGGVGVNAFSRAVKGQGMIHNAFATLGDLSKYGAGKSAEKLRAELAAGISETDPAVLAAALKEARRAAAAARLKGKTIGKTAGASGLAAGRTASAIATAGNQ